MEQAKVYNHEMNIDIASIINCIVTLNAIHTHTEIYISIKCIPSAMHATTHIFLNFHNSSVAGSRLFSD